MSNFMELQAENRQELLDICFNMNHQENKYSLIKHYKTAKFSHDNLVVKNTGNPTKRYLS